MILLCNEGSFPYECYRLWSSDAKKYMIQISDFVLSPVNRHFDATNVQRVEADFTSGSCPSHASRIYDDVLV